MHYCRWRKHGDPTVTVIRPVGEMDRLLRAAIATETDECIILPPKASRPTALVDGKAMNASRAVWVIAKGDPGALCVLHTCHRGDEGCINLRHLKLGSQAQNMADMDEAGRRRTADRAGESNGRHVLKEEEAVEIRRRYRAGVVRQVDLADEFNVAQPTVSRIVRGERWVPEGQKRRMVTDRRRRPDVKVKAAILERWEQGGVSQQTLADEFNVGQTTVSRIVRGVK